MVLAVAAVGVAGPGAASAFAQAPTYPINYPVPGGTTIVPGGTTVIPGQTGPDNQGPFVETRLTASVRRGVLLDVTVDEAATLNASGKVSVPRVRGSRARTFRLPPVTGNAEPKVQVRLRLRFSRRARAALLRALRRGRRGTARVNLTATDLAGNRTAVTATGRVKR